MLKILLLFDAINAQTEDGFYILKTPGDNQHTKMWLTTVTPYIEFEFQSCSDLKVALSTNPKDITSNTYEIIIGGWKNTKSVIRRGIMQSTVAEADSPDIVSCDELRPFWIGWENGNMTVGQGKVTGQDVLMFYEDPSPYFVTAVSLASGFDGYGNGTYRVSLDQAQMAFAKTPARFGYDTLWRRQVQKSHITFGVRACNDAILALSQEMEMTTASYEIVIGGCGNEESNIR